MGEESGETGENHLLKAGGTYPATCIHTGLNSGSSRDKKAIKH